MASREAPSAVDTTICIATINTATVTELCLRSIDVHDSGHPYQVVVGDCGSTDGTLLMLSRFRSRGVIAKIEEAPDGRRHEDWLDHWVATATTPYLVFLDSDIEIRRDGWLAELHKARADTDAALAGADLIAPFTLPDDPSITRAQRLAAHCLLVDVNKIRTLGRKFGDPPGQRRVYDVGAWIFDGLPDAGYTYAVMPRGWEGDAIRHWYAMSYSKASADLRRHWLKTIAVVSVRLTLYRLAGRRAAQALSALSSLRGARRN